MKPRKSDFVKPADWTDDRWLLRLESDKRDLMAQVRREVHTRGFAHGKYAERLDRAIHFARLATAQVQS